MPFTFHRRSIFENRSLLFLNLCLKKHNLKPEETLFIDDTARKYQRQQKAEYSYLDHRPCERRCDDLFNIKK